MELVLNIIHGFKENNNAVAVFLYMSKPFDTIIIEIILHKLEKYGLRGLPLDWFRNYLSESKQCTVSNEATSTPMELKYR